MGLNFSVFLIIIIAMFGYSVCGGIMLILIAVMDRLFEKPDWDYKNRRLWTFAVMLMWPGYLFTWPYFMCEAISYRIHGLGRLKKTVSNVANAEHEIKLSKDVR